MTTPNIPLLRKYVEWVEEQEARTEDREWWQAYWATDFTYPAVKRQAELAGDEIRSCGTAFCLAGKVAVDHGWMPIWRVGEARYVRKDGRIREIPDVARVLLGVVDHELFHADNTAADIRRIAEDIAGERL